MMVGVLLCLAIVAPANTLRLKLRMIDQAKSSAWPSMGEYHPDAYMPLRGSFTNEFSDFSYLTEKVWDHVPGISFNPSLITLPTEGLHTLHKDARYAAIVRTTVGTGQCRNT